MANGVNGTSGSSWWSCFCCCCGDSASPEREPLRQPLARSSESDSRDLPPRAIQPAHIEQQRVESQEAPKTPKRSHSPQPTYSQFQTGQTGVNDSPIK